MQHQKRQQQQQQSDEDDDTSTWVGRDTDDNRFASVNAMWQSQGVVIGRTTTAEEEREEGATASSSSLHHQQWYDRAAEHYQSHCEATLDGVLGGFAPLSRLDLAASQQFVQQLQAQGLLPCDKSLSQCAACEMGAGIGRVTKGLLLPLGFGQVDVVESAAHLLAAAPEYIGDEVAGKCRYYCTPLQNWTSPSPYRYTLIWIQWVFCYLTDDHAVQFLKQCKEGLLRKNNNKQEGGLIVLKENTTPTTLDNDDNDNDQPLDDFILDTDDASVTRSIRYLRRLACQAGLRVVLLQEAQEDLPQDNFPVTTLALAPV